MKVRHPQSQWRRWRMEDGNWRSARKAVSPSILHRPISIRVLVCSGRAPVNDRSIVGAAATDQSNGKKKQKQRMEISLARKAIRVKVILPPEKVSETKTPTPEPRRQNLNHS